MLKPICVPCKRFFRMKTQGFMFLEGMPKSGMDRPLAGTQELEKWTPYKLWAGDLWECEGCGAQIVSGTGQNRVAEHYETDFARQVDLYGAAQLQVNDC